MAITSKDERAKATAKARSNESLARDLFLAADQPRAYGPEYLRALQREAAVRLRALEGMNRG
jgi:hypothetical protein